MKKKISTLILLCCFAGFAQNVKKNKKKLSEIEIDLQSTIYKKTSIKNPGKYEIVISNYDSNKSYEIEIERSFHQYEPLKIPKLDTFGIKSLKNLSKKIIDTINLRRGQDLSIKIDVYKSEKDDKEKVTVKKEKTYNYTFTTERKGKWQTTFGFNFIALGDKDSFFSKQENSTYIITKGANQNKLDFHPSIMFTWLPNNTKTINVGFSGGLGYDLEKSLSVFSGVSFIFNQNIIITGGMAFHNQKLLNSQYTEGDALKENLTFEQLHKDYIRFNPFISIAFRLDKSPF